MRCILVSKFPYNDVFLFVFYALLSIEKTKGVSLCTWLSFCNWELELEVPPNYVEPETHHPEENNFDQHQLLLLNYY